MEILISIIRLARFGTLHARRDVHEFLHGRSSIREVKDSIIWTWIEVKFSLDALLKARKAHA